MTIRGIQRGQQGIPGITPVDGTADAQASEGAATDFSALLSQMASQVGATVPDSAGATLMSALKATAAVRQETKAAEPTRPRPERERPDRPEPSARPADRADRGEDRAEAQDAAPTKEGAATETDGAAAEAVAQPGVVQAVAVAPVVTEAAAAVAAAVAVSDQEITPEQVAAVQAVQAQTQTATQDTRATGPAQQGPAQPGKGQRDDGMAQTPQAVQAAQGEQQAQSGLSDDGSARQDASANRPQMLDPAAKAAKTALTEAQAATNADAAVETGPQTDGPLTTVNAEQSKGLAKAIGDDRPVSVQVQTETAARQTAVQSGPVDADGPTNWYDLAKPGAQAPTNGTVATAQAADGAQQQPLLGLGAVAAASAPGGAANSAAVAASADGVSGVDGVKASSGASQTGSASATAAAQAPEQAQRTAKAQAAKPAARPQAAEEQDPVEQIRVRIQQDAAKGETIKIALRPDNLGKVEVKLDIREGKVNAQVVAETSETLEMMKTDVRGLEKALNDAGLRADPGSVTFSLKDGGTQQQMAQQDQGQAGQQGPGTPYDRVGHSLDDDLAPELGTIDALRSAQAAARGGVDVRI